MTDICPNKIGQVISTDLMGRKVLPKRQAVGINVDEFEKATSKIWDVEWRKNVKDE